MAQEAILARRYARGLAELAGEANSLDQVRSHIAAVAQLVDPAAHNGEMPDLLRFLESPEVTPEEKCAATERILEQLHIGSETIGLVCVLVQRNRAALLPKIARAYAEMAADMAGEYTALVQTARPLRPEQEQRLAAALSDAFQCTVRLHIEIQPGLLAGAKVTIGDKTFDGSVQGRLDAMRHRLTATGWEALQEENAHAADPVKGNDHAR